MIAKVKELGGLDYAEGVMRQYQQDALAILERYPQSPYKDSLVLMVNYVIDRKK